MKSLRTDDSRFSNLPGYAFKPHYAEVDDLEGGSLRMHYLDEGEGDLVLCLHGQPSWSYLYRKMIPILVAGGCRVIAPDLIGFGKSDKPASRDNYTYANHVAWLTDLLTQLDLRDITMICQDWGGLIGLRCAAENQARFARIVVANTGLPDAADIADDKVQETSDFMRAHYESIPVPENNQQLGTAMATDNSGLGFLHWVKFASDSTGFNAGNTLKTVCGDTLSDEEQAAYDAPFPSEEYMMGARQFPSLVPLYPDNPAIAANRAAWKTFSTWEKPVLTAFSDSDPITAGANERFENSIPGAKGQAHTIIKGAGHFLQEQAPEELSEAALKFIRDNPLG